MKTKKRIAPVNEILNRNYPLYLPERYRVVRVPGDGQRQAKRDPAITPTLDELRTNKNQRAQEVARHLEKVLARSLDAVKAMGLGAATAAQSPLVIYNTEIFIPDDGGYHIAWRLQWTDFASNKLFTVEPFECNRKIEADETREINLKPRRAA